MTRTERDRRYRLAHRQQRLAYMREYRERRRPKVARIKFLRLGKLYLGWRIK